MVICLSPFVIQQAFLCSAPNIAQHKSYTKIHVSEGLLNMTTGITIIYNSFLYYCNLIIFARYILNYTPRKAFLVGSFLSFIPLSFIALSNDESLISPVYISFEIIQFFLLKLSFKGIKIRFLLVLYILLYCFSMVLTSFVVTFSPNAYNYIDVIINTLISVLCVLMCITRMNYKIHQMLISTPKYIIIISSLLLIIAASTSVFISYFQYGDFPEVWNRWIQTLTSFLLMAICLVVPVIFVISISNTRLKTLTVDYEQQIHAQAEHYKNLAEANYEARRFRHDFKNIQIAIESLLTQEKYEEATDLIRQCSHQLDQSVAAKAKFDTGNGIADALLTDKQEKATDYNTTISFDGIIPAETLSPTDLCVLLGNSLDNALDACKQMPEDADKTIAVSCNCSSGFLFLTVTNPIDHAVQIRGNHIATTKENKTLHGFGLYSLHTIVKKYDGEIQLSATEDSFTISIDLCMMSSIAKASPA